LWSNKATTFNGISSNSGSTLNSNKFTQNIINYTGTGFVIHVFNSNICFIGSTLIHTDQGHVSIDQIDIVKNTIRGGKPIVAVTRTKNTDDYAVCIEKDALGPNIPSAQTTMSGNHALWYEGKMQKAHLLLGRGIAGVQSVEYSGEVLYNLNFPNTRYHKNASGIVAHGHIYRPFPAAIPFVSTNRSPPSFFGTPLSHSLASDAIDQADLPPLSLGHI
jgi:hypothetical protein